MGWELGTDTGTCVFVLGLKVIYYLGGLEAILLDSKFQNFVVEETNH